jgi:hypothetical protein
MFWTPIVTALILAMMMFASVILVNRISVIGDTILEALMAGSGGNRCQRDDQRQRGYGRGGHDRRDGVDEATGLPTALTRNSYALSEGSRNRACQRIIISRPGKEEDTSAAGPTGGSPAPPYEMTIEEGAGGGVELLPRVDLQPRARAEERRIR